MSEPTLHISPWRLPEDMGEDQPLLPPELKALLPEFKTIGPPIFDQLVVEFSQAEGSVFAHSQPNLYSLEIFQANAQAGAEAGGPRHAKPDDGFPELFFTPKTEFEGVVPPDARSYPNEYNRLSGALNWARWQKKQAEQQEHPPAKGEEPGSSTLTVILPVPRPAPQEIPLPPLVTSPAIYAPPNGANTIPIDSAALPAGPDREGVTETTRPMVPVPAHPHISERREYDDSPNPNRNHHTKGQVVKSVIQALGSGFLQIYASGGRWHALKD